MFKWKEKSVRLSTMQMLAAGFLLVIVIGGVLLWLPVCNQEPIAFTDALFTSTSAVCVTGLMTVVPATQFTLLGKVVLLVLIQIGGLGVANLKPAAKDFRIFWDNAYIIHHLYDDRQDHLLNIIEECEKAGNPDMVYEFVSTSKVSYPGAGIAALISSEANIKEAQEYMNFQIIGHDKLNQLRHVKFFQNLDGVMNQMKKHAEILRPKFEAILQVMDQELSGLGIASWTKPNGGYFISFDAMEGCAKKIVAKAKEAGLTMTGAGATYPYHNDPQDSNIRIAPSFPTPEELEIAGQVFVLSVKLVSVDKILESK